MSSYSTSLHLLGSWVSCAWKCAMLSCSLLECMYACALQPFMRLLAVTHLLILALVNSLALVFPKQ